MVEKKAQMGDFIGFCFNNTHSSELGLVRVSDGSRYEKNLLPSLTDKTVQVPGRDGFYYFGSSYNNNEFPIKVAFDNLEEEDFRKMVDLFKDKKPHFLWFDECPYKEYLVKVKNPPNFKYICFEEEIDKKLYSTKIKGYYILLEYIEKFFSKEYAENHSVRDFESDYNDAIVKANRGVIDDSVSYPNTGSFGSILTFYGRYYSYIQAQSWGQASAIRLFVIIFLKQYINNNIEYTTEKSISRIYKGEGVITFINYSSYARGRVKSIDSIVSNVITKSSSINMNWFNNYFLDGNNQIIEYYNENNELVQYPNLDIFFNPFGSEQKVQKGEALREIFQQNQGLSLQFQDSLFNSYNKDEWCNASRLLQNISTINNGDGVNLPEIKNCGDIDMDIKFCFHCKKTTGQCYFKLIDEDNKEVGSILIDIDKLLTTAEKKGDGYLIGDHQEFFFDSRNKLLRNYTYVYDDINPVTGEYNKNYYYWDMWDDKCEGKNVYNNCIISGDFFKVPAAPYNTTYRLECSTDENNEPLCIIDQVDFTYLYY